MKVLNYVRKPVTIQAVQVTEADMNDISNWCGGRIIVDFEDTTQTHIKVRVIKPQDERQTQAFVGDWILKLGKSFKVYTDDAFKKGFDSAPVEIANDAHLNMLKEYVNSPKSRQDASGIMHKMSGAFTSAEDYNKYHDRETIEKDLTEQVKFTGATITPNGDGTVIIDYSTAIIDYSTAIIESIGDGSNLTGVRNDLMVEGS